jgi:hypothetical protein
MMLKPLSKLMLSMLVCHGVAMAQDAGKAPSGVTWKQQLQSATWPRDIVRLAERGLQQSPDAATARDLTAMRERADASSRVLQGGRVQLTRAAFSTDTVAPDLHADLHLAALGDADAAVRIAHSYRPKADSSATDAYRQIGWLQFASELGNDSAAYELALLYRRDGQPAKAAVYETRAVAMGYALPTSLDNVRK